MAYDPKYYQNRKRRHKSQGMFRKYNLTLEEYERRCEAQNNECACCGQRAKLVIDHDHDTGELRGLICSSCNTGIGQLGDSIEGLQRAIDYLRTPVEQPTEQWSRRPPGGPRKLTIEQVEAIWFDDRPNRDEVAADYGIHGSMVAKIWNRTAWRSTTENLAKRPKRGPGGKLLPEVCESCT